eukprot:gene2006-2281_t
MLQNSWLYNAANNEDILDAPQWSMNESVHLKPYLVGDAAYPLSRWLMKPFPYCKSMPEHQKAFNLALSQARVSIERDFSVLKKDGGFCLEKTPENAGSKIRDLLVDFINTNHNNDATML